MSSEPTVTIHRRGVERFQAGHPWVYQSDVVSAAGVTAGEVVRVVDQRGWFQGRAFYSSTSKISLRLLTRDDEPVDAAFFHRRLEAAKAMRETAFPDSDSWRAVHGEADLIPGLVVDRYGDVLVVQLLTQGVESRRELFTDLLRQIYQPRAIVDRSDAKVRLLEGLEQRKGMLFGEDPGPTAFTEGTVRQTIDPMGGQKTGAFLDQRENHLAARQYARGRGLDCFAYNGGFALQLATGCTSVTAVEISEPAGEIIKQNAALNGLGNVEVVVANAFDFLKAKSEGPERFDVIVLDPPAFAKSKASIDAAERGYKEINLRALQLLNPGGVLITASCSYHIDDAHFEDILWSAAIDAQRAVQIIERRGAGRDHPVLMGARETRYLKCYVLRAL